MSSNKGDLWILVSIRFRRLPPPAPPKGFRVKELEQARDKLTKRVEEASAREKGADARVSALEEQVVDLKAKIEQAL